MIGVGVMDRADCEVWQIFVSGLQPLELFLWGTWGFAPG